MRQIHYQLNSLVSILTAFYTDIDSEDSKYNTKRWELMKKEKKIVEYICSICFIYFIWWVAQDVKKENLLDLFNPFFKTYLMCLIINLLHQCHLTLALNKYGNLSYLFTTMSSVVMTCCLYFKLSSFKNVFSPCALKTMGFMFKSIQYIHYQFNCFHITLMTNQRKYTTFRIVTWLVEQFSTSLSLLQLQF